MDPVMKTSKANNLAGMRHDYPWRMGLEFNSIAQFRGAIKEHALLNGRHVRYIKNSKLRCRVMCMGYCLE